MTDVPVEGKRKAILTLVRRLVGAGDNPRTPPTTFCALSDGFIMYQILHQVSPARFPDVEELTNCSDLGSGDSSWAARKGNLLTLIRHMNEYAREALGATSDFNLLVSVDSNSIARCAALDQADGSSTAPSSDDAGLRQLDELVDVFVVMVVLSGVGAIMKHVEGLSREEQTILSRTARATLKAHKFVAIKRYDTPSLHSRQASALRQPSALRSTTDQRAMSPLSSTSAPQLVADGEAHYRRAVDELRTELAEMKARLSEAQSKYELCSAERVEVDAKYRLLLTEREAQPSRIQTEAEVQSRLLQKDELIATLNARVDDQSASLTKLRDTMASMKDRLKQGEQEYILRSNERQEALQKLSVAEDKLIMQEKARAELQDQMEDLRSQVAQLRLNQRTGTAMEPNEGLALSNASFDNVVRLENELDVVRSEKNTLKKQLRILQMQVSASATDGLSSDSTAVTELWKARHRQSEKTNTELRQQLQAAQARIEELQMQHPSNALGASCSMISVANPESAAAGATSSRRKVSGTTATRNEIYLSSLVLESQLHRLLEQQRPSMPSSVRAHPTLCSAEESAEQHTTHLTLCRRKAERGLMESVFMSTARKP